MKHKVALSAGGNIGDVEKNTKSAVCELCGKGLSEPVISSFYKTEPVACPEGTSYFINSAFKGFWSGSLDELFDKCKSLEIKYGRPAVHEPNVSRTLDLDIVFFDDLVLKSEKLTIPHSEAHRRLFVLEPLSEIMPEKLFPDTHITVREQLEIVLQSSVTLSN